MDCRDDIRDLTEPECAVVAIEVFKLCSLCKLGVLRSQMAWYTGTRGICFNCYPHTIGTVRPYGREAEDVK